MMRDEEFYRKLLERLVLRFQGVEAFMDRMPERIPAKHGENLAVRAMIQMIAHAVIEEVKAIQGPAVLTCPCGQRSVSDITGKETKMQRCERCGELPGRWI
jgi:hypothetical protein